MKRGFIIEAFRLINGIKMNTVQDKATRSAIIGNHLQMYKVAEKHENEAKEVYKKLFEGKEEDARKVNELRQEYNSTGVSNERKVEIVKEISTAYTPILELEQELNAAINGMLAEEVEVKIIPFNKESFVNACADSNLEFTMIDIIRLNDLFEEEKIVEDK